MDYEEFRFRWVSWISSYLSVVTICSLSNMLEQFDLIFILVMLHGLLNAQTCKAQWQRKCQSSTCSSIPAFLFKKSWIIWKLSALKFKVINVSALKFTERKLIEVKLKCIFQIQRIFAMVIEIRNIYNLVFLIRFLRWNKTRM